MGCVTTIIKDLVEKNHLDKYVKVTLKNANLIVIVSMICSIQNK